MSTLTKTYILLGMLMASITKFPSISWQNLLAVISMVILLVCYQIGVEEFYNQRAIKGCIKVLRDMGHNKEADRLEKLLTTKKSFIEKMKDEKEDDNGLF